MLISVVSFLIFFSVFRNDIKEFNRNTWNSTHLFFLFFFSLWRKAWSCLGGKFLLWKYNKILESFHVFGWYRFNFPLGVFLFLSLFSWKFADIAFLENSLFLASCLAPCIIALLPCWIIKAFLDGSSINEPASTYWYRYTDTCHHLAGFRSFLFDLFEFDHRTLTTCVISTPLASRGESTRRFTGPRMEDSALGFFSISHDSTSRPRNARDTRVETFERTWADRPITRSATNRFLHAVLADVQHAVSLPDGLETCWAIFRFFFTPILKFPLENGNQFSMIISRNVSQRIGISTRIMVN